MLSRPGDAIQLSNLANSLLELAGTDRSGQAGRMARLGLEVRTGRYTVDAMQVSRAMIEAAWQPAA